MIQKHSQGYSNGETDVEYRLMDTERGGEGETCGESNIEAYITIYKIDSQWEFAVWLRELKQGLCNNIEGWKGREMRRRFKRERTCVYLWLIHVEV